MMMKGQNITDNRKGCSLLLRRLYSTPPSFRVSIISPFVLVFCCIAHNFFFVAGINWTIHFFKINCIMHLFKIRIFFWRLSRSLIIKSPVRYARPLFQLTFTTSEPISLLRQNQPSNKVQQSPLFQRALSGSVGISVQISSLSYCYPFLLRLFHRSFHGKPSFAT